MPSFYGEYTTLSDLRASGEGSQLNISGTAADAQLLRTIREVSRDIDGAANRQFVPVIQTRLYDVGKALGRSLTFDDDLLEITTLTNGDSTVIVAGNQILYPANVYPKQELRLKASSGLYFVPDTSGNREQVISVAGVFGYHDNYSLAWYSAGTVSSGLAASASATSYTASASHGIVAGMLLKIESEYVYVSSVSSNTITIVRGVNGSTAATHADATAVSYWGVINSVQSICRLATAARWNLRANPTGQTITINGASFNTPNDITQWIWKELAGVGLIRMAFA